MIEKLKGLSPTKIFYCLEEVSDKLRYVFPLASDCDAIIFPEENRAKIYANRLRVDPSKTKLFVIHNSNNNEISVDVGEKNNRVLYAGSIHREITFAKYFEDRRIASLPIDLFGLVDGYEDKNDFLDNLQIENGARYLGYMKMNDNFFRTISKYLYSVIIWNPDLEDRYFAAPNKLFDALASGIPPISAPHPQCKEIIDRYQCGIVLQDWSLEALRDGIQKGLDIANSKAYSTMVANGMEAMKTELCWDRQFEKFAPFIEHALQKQTS